MKRILIGLGIAGLLVLGVAGCQQPGDRCAVTYCEVNTGPGSGGNPPPSLPGPAQNQTPPPIGPNQPGTPCTQQGAISGNLECDSGLTGLNWHVR